jgi:hypothetical protein
VYNFADCNAARIGIDFAAASSSSAAAAAVGVLLSPREVCCAMVCVYGAPARASSRVPENFGPHQCWTVRRRSLTAQRPEHGVAGAEVALHRKFDF